MTQRDLKRIVIFVIGIALLILSWGFFSGSGVGEPMLDSGSLGEVGFGIWSSIIEIVFSILTSAIGLLLFVLLKGANYVSSILQPMFNSYSGTVELTTVGTDAMMEDLSRVLLQAIIDRDKVLTIAIAEKIAGQKFLTDEPKFVSSFPKE